MEKQLVVVGEIAAGELGEERRRRKERLRVLGAARNVTEEKENTMRNKTNSSNTSNGLGGVNVLDEKKKEKKFSRIGSEKKTRKNMVDDVSKRMGFG